MALIQADGKFDMEHLWDAPSPGSGIADSGDLFKKGSVLDSTKRYDARNYRVCEKRNPYVAGNLRGQLGRGVRCFYHNSVANPFPTSASLIVHLPLT